MQKLLSRHALLGTLLIVFGASCTPSAPPPAPTLSEDELQTLVKNKAIVDQGRELFATHCARCHGNQGEGQIGPNLTDEYWIDGNGSLQSVVTMIHSGKLDKGMPAWSQMLTPEKITAAAAFVGSLRGTQPANAKAPQGERRPRP